MSIVGNMGGVQLQNRGLTTDSNPLLSPEHGLQKKAGRQVPELRPEQISDRVLQKSKKPHDIKQVYSQLLWSGEICSKDRLEDLEHEAVRDMLKYLHWAGEEIGRFRQVLNEEYVANGCFKIFLEEARKNTKSNVDSGLPKQPDISLIRKEFNRLLKKIENSYQKLDDFAKKNMISLPGDQHITSESTRKVREGFEWLLDPLIEGQENDESKEILWNEESHSYELRWGDNGYSAVLSNYSHYYSLYTKLNGRLTGILRSHVDNKVQWYINDPKNDGQKIELERTVNGEFFFTDTKEKRRAPIEYLALVFDLTDDNCRQFDVSSETFRDHAVAKDKIDFLAFGGENMGRNSSIVTLFENQTTPRLTREIVNEKTSNVKLRSPMSPLSEKYSENSIESSLPEEENDNNSNENSPPTTGANTPEPSPHGSPIATVEALSRSSSKLVLPVIPEGFMLEESEEVHDIDVKSIMKEMSKESPKNVVYLSYSDKETKQLKNGNRETETALEIKKFLHDINFPGESAVKDLNELGDLAARSIQDVDGMLVEDIEFARELVLNLACNDDPGVRRWVGGQLSDLYRLDPERLANLSLDVIRFLDPNLKAMKEWVNEPPKEERQLEEEVDIGKSQEERYWENARGNSKGNPPYMLALMAYKAMQQSGLQDRDLENRLRCWLKEDRVKWLALKSDSAFGDQWQEVVGTWDLLDDDI